VPELGHETGECAAGLPSCYAVSALTESGRAHPELVGHVVASTGLPPEVAARVVADVLAYFHETTEQFVRRRHGELLRRGHGNAVIWPLIAGELRQRRVAAAELSQRQLRRIVYG
jgi:hypothetical protein